MKYPAAKRIVEVDEIKVSFDEESESELKRIQQLLGKLKSIVRENNIADREKLLDSNSSHRVAAILGIIVAVAGITSAFLKFRSIVNVSTRMLKRFDSGEGTASSEQEAILNKIQMDSEGGAKEDIKKANPVHDDSDSLAVRKDFSGDSVAHEVAGLLEKIISGVEKINELIGDGENEIKRKGKTPAKGYSGGVEESKYKKNSLSDSRKSESVNVELTVLTQELMDYVYDLTKLVGGKCNEHQVNTVANQTNSSGKKNLQYRSQNSLPGESNSIIL